MACEDSLLHLTPFPVRRSGGFGPFPAPASSDPIAGPAICICAVARQPGCPVPSIPDLNTVYWGTSNAAPDFDGDVRPGDDLYTSCVLALNPDTGKLKWYFQFTPHDLYDYDATETPVLIDAQYQGVPRKLLVQANRNGFLYVLDRARGDVSMRLRRSSRS